MSAPTAPTSPMLGKIIRNEFAHSVNAVGGRMHNCIGGWHPGTFSNQQWVTSKEYRNAKGTRCRILVRMEFDDNCKNGHNTFHITGNTQIWDAKSYKPGFREDGGGCLHEEIAEQFPELVPLIKWHGTHTQEPLHYAANAVYLAGDRDCWGLRKGEQRQIRNGRTGLLAWKLEGPGTRYHDGDAPPAEEIVTRWQPWMRTGEGKARELDAARDAAVWPDATDAELMQEPDALRAALVARLPALMEQFKADMLAAGFLYECPMA